MVLNTLSAILGFFLFVAPGLLWDILTDRRRSTGHSSVFREAGIVALVSTVCTLVALVIVVGVATWVNSPWLGQLQMITERSLGFSDNAGQPKLGGPLGLLLIELVVALGVAYLLDRLLGGRLFGPTSLHLSGWVEAIRHHGIEGDTRIYAAVALTSDGSGFRGEVEKYSTDLAMESREITLVAPVVRFWIDDDGEEQRRQVMEARVVIPGREIKSVSFIYLPRAIEPDPEFPYLS
jgi:hypothetical protein